VKLSSRHSVVGAVLVLGLLSGCGPGWKVLKASNPTALAAANNVAVAFDYSNMMVERKTVEAWKAEKTAEDAKYPETWNDLMGKFEGAVLAGIRDEFPSAHAAAQGPGDVTLTIRPTTFGMGKYIVVTAWPTVMDVVIGARPGEGENTDEIEVKRSYQASLYQPSVFQHITPVGTQIGQAAGRFLASKKAK
jgi:hypothetical protein